MSIYSLSTLQPQNQPPFQSTHSIVTRSNSGIFKPKLYSSVLHTETKKPFTTTKALLSQSWITAIKAYFDALMRNNTWELEPTLDQMKIIGNKWVFKVKQKTNSSVEVFQARLVAKEYHQTPDLNFNETFSSVVKSATIWVILSIAVLKNWGIMLVNVNNAFLNGKLLEDVFMEQPEGFIDVEK